jgi:1-deoxy-D-xylulose-5-phosphate reductoisomerase
MVSFKDGTTNALLAIPDMRIPIANALFGANGIGREFINVDLSEVGSLTFSNPDNKRFPALEMARDALKIGTQALIAYNASSEVAVQNFILKKISFSDIYTVMKNCLLYSETLKNKDVSNLYNILSLDEHIKTYALDIIKEIEVA